jgi:hypothetical protein
MGMAQPYAGGGGLSVKASRHRAASTASSRGREWRRSRRERSFPGALAFAARASVDFLSLKLNNSTLAAGRRAYAPTDDHWRRDRR